MKHSSLLMLTLMLIFATCGEVTGLSPTMVPSRTAIPSSTSTPIVKSVCVQVNAGDFSEEISQVTQRLLTGLGLEAVSPGGVCDATLTFDLTIEPVSAYYTGIPAGGGYCYTGAKATGSFTYTITGYSPQSYPVERQIGPTTGMISYCPGPSEAPVDEIWPDTVLYSLYLVWENEVIFAAVEDEDEDIRSQALGWLTSIGRDNNPEAERAISVVLQALQSDPSPIVRVAAVYAARDIGRINKDERAISALVQALGDTEPRVRATAAMCIGDVARSAFATEEKPISAIPALIETLQDSDSYVRYCATNALGAFGPDAIEAVPALISLLGDESQMVRMAAIDALEEIGPGAVEAVPALIQALSSDDVNVQKSAARALVEITGQDFGEDAAAWQGWWETQK